MRLSEKTLELNICAQASHLLTRGQGQRLFWFGLTQKQEARAGFDACTRFGGRLLIFQFKASHRVLRNGARVFQAPHDQMQALTRQTHSYMRSVFYAFPLVGTTADIARNPDLLAQTWLLDVADLPPLGPPTTLHGVLRKNRCHNIYVTPGRIEIHSDPVRAESIVFSELLSSGFAGADGLQHRFQDNFEQFREFASLLSPGARGLIAW